MDAVSRLVCTCHTKWSSRINAGWTEVLARLRGTISLEQYSAWSKSFRMGVSRTGAWRAEPSAAMSTDMIVLSVV